MNVKLPNLSVLFSFIMKFGGAAVASYGVNVHNLRDMTVGSIVALVTHGWDSIFNSPPATPPKT